MNFLEKLHQKEREENLALVEKTAGFRFLLTGDTEAVALVSDVIKNHTKLQIVDDANLVITAKMAGSATRPEYAGYCITLHHIKPDRRRRGDDRQDIKTQAYNQVFCVMNLEARKLEKPKTKEEIETYWNS